MEKEDMVDQGEVEGAEEKFGDEISFEIILPQINQTSEIEN